MFFKDIRAKRRLMEIAADRLSIRRYLGYVLRQPLPAPPSIHIGLIDPLAERFFGETPRCPGALIHPERPKVTIEWL
jgi:hypothetical protein